MNNGDKVIVRGMFEDDDRVECIVVGIASRDIISREPYMYIVKPIVKIGEWECYTAMRHTIEQAKC